MANLEQLISQKAERDKSWREQRQMERENAYDMQDAGIVEVTSNPEMYGRYLAMQGDNPMYSPGNVVLVMFTKPEFTQFGTRDRWKTLRRYVPDSMVGKGTQIFAAPGSRNPFVEAYDITQTEGRPIERLQLADDSPEMESALNTLLNHAVVPITVNHDLESPAFYDEVQMELLVNPSYPDSEAFPAIAAEVVHCRFHAKGYNAGYTREDYDLHAQSISYLLCRRYVVERELPNVSVVSEHYESLDPQERKKILDGLQDMSKQIGGAIEYNIKPQQKAPVIPTPLLNHSR